MQATAHMWKAKANLQESIFSFYHVDLRDSTQVVWSDHKCLYLLSLLRSPTTGISKLENTF